MGDILTIEDYNRRRYGAEQITPMSGIIAWLGYVREEDGKRYTAASLQITPAEKARILRTGLVSEDNFYQNGHEYTLEVYRNELPHLRLDGRAEIIFNSVATARPRVLTVRPSRPQKAYQW